MRLGLSSKERNGLIVMGLLVTLIVVTGFLLNRCGSQSVSSNETAVDSVEVRLMDSDEIQGETERPLETKKSRKKQPSKSQKSRKSKNRKGSISVKTGADRVDPFSDTVPQTYY